jgi:hypothetical protein
MSTEGTIGISNVVIPNVYRVLEFPALAATDANPFFIFEIVTKGLRPGLALNNLAGLRTTEKDAISFAIGRAQYTSSKFVILTAPTLTEAKTLFDRANKRFAL